MTERVWMDSGAFSAYTLGTNLSLYEYTRWVTKWADFIDYYAVLDDIRDPEKTYANQREMEKLGATPVPTYHFGEDLKWLERYIEEGYTYIALGGMVPIESRDLRVWLDMLWGDYLTTEDGKPRVKVHGFGLTTVDLIPRYPWFSVDSSTWLKSGAFGMVQIHVPPGQFLRVAVSENSPSKEFAGRHITTLSLPEQAFVEGQIKAYGQTREDCEKDYRARANVNMRSFTEVGTRLWAPKPFVQQPSLMGQSSKGNWKADPDWPWSECRVYLAALYSKEIETDHFKNGSRRMYSYHELHKSPTWWAEIMRLIQNSRKGNE